MKVLLLGAGGNAGMNFIKCLQMAGGYDIVGTEISKYNRHSSLAGKTVLLPTEAEAKLAFVQALVEQEQPDVVHAQPDAEVRFLLENSREIGVKHFSHDLEHWKTFADKVACQSIWSGTLGYDFLSVAYPSLTDIQLGMMLERDKRVWVRCRRGAGSKGALPCRTLNQIDAWVRYWIEVKGYSEDDFMVSEYLPGAEYAVQTFWVGGELVQSQARERVVHFFANVMPSEQSSTPAVARTVADRDVYDTAYRAIRAIQPAPHGIYCVDLRRTVTGVPFPTEVNYGRFFTTSDFFASIGVNTPDAYLRYTVKGDIVPSVEEIKQEIYWLRGLDREPVKVAM